MPSAGDYHFASQDEFEAALSALGAEPLHIATPSQSLVQPAAAAAGAAQDGAPRRVNLNRYTPSDIGAIPRVYREKLAAACREMSLPAPVYTTRRREHGPLGLDTYTSVVAIASMERITTPECESTSVDAAEERAAHHALSLLCDLAAASSGASAHAEPVLVAVAPRNPISALTELCQRSPDLKMPRFEEYAVTGAALSARFGARVVVGGAVYDTSGDGAFYTRKTAAKAAAAQLALNALTAPSNA